MSPIEGISDIKKFPRLGKIRLGIKKEGQRGSYPQAVDYFVCPEEVQAVFGERPTELKVMFPANDLDLVAPQWYKCYSYSQGLICKGNGRTCWRKVDKGTGDFASKDTKQWERMNAVCNPNECLMLASKQCRKMMSLFFILPDVPGLGVYQLDTSSFYSIVNINSQLREDGFLRPFTKGKIAFIPLILSLGPQVVNPPGEGRKTVHVLFIRDDVKLADLIRISRQKPAQVLLPGVSDEEPPEDLFPDKVIGGPKIEGQTTKESKTCSCSKPLPQQEVSMAEDGTVWHSTCSGYICTPPIDCFPGCPHMPPEREAREAPLKGDEKIGPTTPSTSTQTSSKEPQKAKTAHVSNDLPPSLDQVTRESVPDFNTLCRLCWHFWKMQPQAVCKELGHRSQMDAYSYYNASPEKLWDAWLTIKNVKTEKPPEG